MKILDSGISTAENNMAIDYDLLRGLESSQEPILHLYDWKGRCATYGHFIKPHALLYPEKLAEWELAKRPTGGGFVFHKGDFAFSVLISSGHPVFCKNTLTNYETINRIVVNAIMKFSGKQTTLFNTAGDNEHSEVNSYCLAKPTKYDVMIQGRKVGGAAQRQTKAGFLHQGTIFLTLPPLDELESLLINGNKIVTAMRQNSYTLINETENFYEAKEKLKGVITQEFQKSLI